MEYKILHLYHDLMNLYGESGNVRALARHLSDQGFQVVVDRKSVSCSLYSRTSVPPSASV